MAVKPSGGLITFGVINIVIALGPMCAGCLGVTSVVGNMRLNVNGRELGPDLKNHIERNVPGATIEAWASAALGSFCSAFLIAGAVGLFLTQNWARWLTIGAACLLILTMCVHDVYQLAVFRPAVVDFLDQHLGNMRPEERAGFKFGFTGSLFCWSCSNPLVMIYLFGMCLFLSVTGAFKKGRDDARRSRRRRPRYDDYDDDDEHGRFRV